MCNVIKSFHGWEAESFIALESNRFLRIFTMKRYGGALTTTATCVTRSDRGSLNYIPSEDFHETVITNRVRVTAAAVKRQQLAALAEEDNILARMHAFYRSKAMPEAKSV